MVSRLIASGPLARQHIMGQASGKGNPNLMIEGERKKEEGTNILRGRSQLNHLRAPSVTGRLLTRSYLSKVLIPQYYD